MEKTITKLKISFLCCFLTICNILCAQGSWEEVTASSGTITHRHENAFTKVGDKFYLVGGRGNKAVQIYDPSANTWTNGASPPMQMHHFQAVAYDNKLYVVGAFTGGYPDETPIPNIYIYDPAGNTWSEGPEIPAERRRGSAGVVVYNNKIYVIAGITEGHNTGHVTWFDEYNPSSNTWTILPDAPRARDHYHAALAGNKIVLAGGRRTSLATGQLFNLTVPEVDIYDFGTGTWSTVAANLPTQRAGAAVAVLGDEVLVIGGESMAHMEAHNETEALNINSGAWTTLAPLLNGRHGTQAVEHNGAVYIAAGNATRGGGAELNNMEKYNSLIITPATTKQSTSSSKVNIFPNPVSDNFTVEMKESGKNKKSRAVLLNHIGVPVLETEIFSGSEIDMSALPGGIYFLKIFSLDSGQWDVYKVVKN